MTITRDCPKPHTPPQGHLHRPPSGSPSTKGFGSPPTGHHPKEMKLLRTLTSPFSVCPRVKNTSELPFQLQGQAAVQTTQGEAGARDSRLQLAWPPESSPPPRWPGRGRVNWPSALADSSGSKVQSQSEPPRRNCKSQGSI